MGEPMVNQLTSVNHVQPLTSSFSVVIDLKWTKDDQSKKQTMTHTQLYAEGAGCVLYYLLREEQDTKQLGHPVEGRSLEVSY